MKRKIIILFLCLHHAYSLAAINAVTSFTVLSDIVQNIGGKYVKVKSLVGLDGDPHTFEPTPKNSKDLAMADVVVLNGLGLEGWINRLVKASGYKKNITIASHGIHVLYATENGINVIDPHAWNSMNNGIIYAKNIMHALMKADPNNQKIIYKQGLIYINQLRKLDNWAMEEFSKIAPMKRMVLTSHNAFSYLGYRYGVTFLAPLNLSTEFESNANKISHLIESLKNNKISTYFIESQGDYRLIKQIALAIGAKPGGILYPEALSNALSPASSYQKAFKHNVTCILQSMH